MASWKKRQVSMFVVFFSLVTAFSHHVTPTIFQTQHLALVAKNTYFLPTNETLNAVAISLKPRLVIE